MKFLRRYAYGMYLGIMTGVMGYGCRNWEFWATIIPVVILVNWGYKQK